MEANPRRLDRRVIITAAALTVIVIASFAAWQIYGQLECIDPDIQSVAKDIRIVISDGVKNRSFYLMEDVSNDLTVINAKLFLTNAGSNPFLHDALPNGQIAFFFIEDIENESLRDNYRDLIICMNKIIENDTLEMVVVFFAEGGYEKWLYYDYPEIGSRLLFHYEWLGPERTRHYGIELITEWRGKK